MELILNKHNYKSTKRVTSILFVFYSKTHITKCCLKASCIQESCITPLLEEVAWEAPLYVVKMRCLPVRELRTVANSVYMKISDCPSRVSVAQRSEHRYVDSETLRSIPGWGSRSFRIYHYVIKIANDCTSDICASSVQSSFEYPHIILAMRIWKHSKKRYLTWINILLTGLNFFNQQLYVYE